MSSKRIYRRRAKVTRRGKRTIGRPTIFGKTLVDEFCRRIAAGRAISAVCGDSDMPNVATIYRWRSDGEHPEFCEKLARAREDRLETIADQMIELGTNVVAADSTLDPARVREAVNAFDKAARLQKEKAPRSVTHHQATGDGPFAVDMSGWPSARIRQYRDLLTQLRAVLSDGNPPALVEET
jgi:hypothetical protein